MTVADMLTMLKTDIGISTTAYDTRLTQYITNAQSEITREGVTIDADSVNDCSLVVMYAAWLWRRRDNMDGMPRMLRYALNNRVLSEKMTEGS